MSKIETIGAFWSELPFILEEAEQMTHDEDAAAMLIEFLEQYRGTWQRIVVTMRLSGAKRALFERSLAVLAERDMDDGIPAG